MHKYHNPQPPEGINTSQTHPLWVFVKLFVAIVIVLTAVAWLLGQSGAWLAARVPYAQEARLAERYLSDSVEKNSNSQGKKHPMQGYLESLVSRLAPHMQLPKGMRIQVHYEAEPVENAYATLGGHIFMYKGLLAKLPNENSLAMLLAHEMAHVKLRHPIQATAQSLAISTGIKYLLGFSNMDLLGNAGLYTQLHFSRTMESAADEQGLQAVYKVYGTVNGASDLFVTLQQLRDSDGSDDEVPFFSTHPLDVQRIESLATLATRQQWNTTLKTTPLPARFGEWLSQ